MMMVTVPMEAIPMTLGNLASGDHYPNPWRHIMY